MWIIEDETQMSEDVRGRQCDYEAATIIHVDESGRFSGDVPPLTVPTDGGLAQYVCDQLNAWEKQGWKFGDSPPVDD